jgi:hypothetical protein
MEIQHLTVPIHHEVKEIQCNNSRWRRGRITVKLNTNTLTHITTSSHVLNKDIHCILFSFNLRANVFPSIYQNYLHYSPIHLMFSIPCIMDQLINEYQQDVTSQYFYFLFCHSLHVWGTLHAHHQEIIKSTAYTTSGKTTVFCCRSSSWLTAIHW